MQDIWFHETIQQGCQIVTELTALQWVTNALQFQMFDAPTIEQERE